MPVDQLVLQGREPALGHGVVPALAGTREALDQAVGVADDDEVGRGVLPASHDGVQKRQDLTAWQRTADPSRQPGRGVDQRLDVQPGEPRSRPGSARLVATRFGRHRPLQPIQTSASLVPHKVCVLELVWTATSGIAILSLARSASGEHSAAAQPRFIGASRLRPRPADLPPAQCTLQQVLLLELVHGVAPGGWRR